MAEEVPQRGGTLHPAGAPPYETLFRAGLFTAVLGIGFDEEGANRSVEIDVELGLVQRGFRRDDAAALRRLQMGGRALPSQRAAHYLKPAAARYQGRPVDAVVTLVLAEDGTRGPEAALAFLDGMDRCEVAVYGGHGRQGMGPDFDRSFQADLLDEYGDLQVRFQASRRLASLVLQRARRQGRSPLSQCRSLLESRRLVLREGGRGCLVIDPAPHRADRLTAYLLREQLRAGVGFLLRQRRFDKKYRCWLFHGCRTLDYFYHLRTASREVSAGGLDLFGTRRSVCWNEMSASLLAFLDGLLQQEDYHQLLLGLSARNCEDADLSGPSHVVDLASSWMR